MTIRETIRRGAGAVGCALLWSALVVVTGPPAGADPEADPGGVVPLPSPPSDSSLIRPLPIVVPTASSWTPKFPFPYDQTKNAVTPADITAMSEMCQWYNAQYATLRFQIDRLQTNRIDDVTGKDYDYTRDNIQQQVDIVTGNIGQAVDFLAPRAQSLTQARNPFGDSYFPIYEGEAFFKLWEQLSNVNNGILAHQPDWFTGPSVQKAKRWGSDIHRSHVCEG
ncbi:hypothetical protein FHT40_004453 [Mycolicibacterium sp. BK556]|uniref:hypothetical protein n=1 Tax=Mycobacteriaceae TaxID=1762 RepID=UPI0010CECF1F|nr:hypothetical protein [Mycobacterium sp. BK086]MBB3604775.1 hypothetical protein [Mycolicibacterium sp. BK556]MBB3634512.1 hypothetical protein [Mycolicibacterium sp. BK607]TDO17664.1 hypothetical protein EV580_0839 [Mycobacterium sp. BK086]